MKPIKIILICIICFFDSYTMQVSQGSFRASLPLPVPLDSNHIKQKLKDLMLVKNISSANKPLDSEMLSVNAVAFKPDSTVFVAAHYNLVNPILKVWSPENKKNLMGYKSDDILSFKCITFTNDGKTLLSGLGQQLYLWDTSSWKITVEIFLDTIDACCLAFSKSGRKMVVGSKASFNNLAIFTLTEQGRRVHFLSGHKKGDVSVVGFSPDSTKVASLSGNRCKIWDATQGNMLYKICGTSWCNCKIEYDKNNKWFLTGYEENDGILGHWFSHNLNTKEMVKVELLGRILPPIKAYERSGCGDYIFLGSAEKGDIDVFNIRTKKYIHTITVPGQGVSTIVVSPDDAYLVIVIKEKVTESLWLYNLIGCEDQKVLGTINQIDAQQLQFLQDILPQKKVTMTVNETMFDYVYFKNLPQRLRTFFHRFIDHTHSSLDQSYILIDPKDEDEVDEWTLMD